MFFLVDDLYEVLNKSSEILIYGAGLYANEVYPVLKKMGLKSKIKSFVVTNIENDLKEIDGIPVRIYTKEMTFNSKEYTLLLAVNKKNSSEILESLQETSYQTIVLLTDYIILNLEEELRRSSDELFSKYIMDGYLWGISKSIEEFKIKRNDIRELTEKRKIEDVDKKTIVFIIGSANPRLLRIIGALIRRGYKIIALGYGTWGIYESLTRAELLSYGIDFFQCETIFELFYFSIKYKPIVYYFEPIWGDCGWADIMIRHESLFGKVVISLYDVLNDCYVQSSDYYKRVERYCLENASGIVWRYFSKEFLQERKGFVYKGKSLHFLDCCNEFNEVETDNKEDVIKLCFICGDTYNVLSENHKNDSVYSEVARLDKILEKLGNRNDCIFHVFAGRASERDKNICRLLTETYSNFKIFYSIPHNELIRRISKYDFGCFLYTCGMIMPDMMTIDNQYYGSAYINSVSNRYFDYIEAGIPIIATRPIKLCDLFEGLGIIVKMNIENIDISFLRDNRKYFKEKVREARRKFLIDTQIQKLIDFFNEL